MAKGNAEAQRPHPHDVSKEPLTMRDPHMMKPRADGTVQVEVLMNMTYLEGRFYQRGAKVLVGQDEARKAVQIGAARLVETVGN